MVYFLWDLWPHTFRDLLHLTFLDIFSIWDLLLYPFDRMFTAYDALCPKFTCGKFTGDRDVWHDRKIVRYDIFWLGIFFYLFFWCSLGPVMRDKTHICSVHDPPWCVIWTSGQKCVIWTSGQNGTVINVVLCDPLVRWEYNLLFNFSPHLVRFTL